MNQAFYEEIGSMSEAKAKKLLGLFEQDPEAKRIVLEHFNLIKPSNEKNPDSQVMLDLAINYMRGVQSQIDD
jgi:hypothetical protein